MDRITKSLLKSFAEVENFGDLPESVQFEHFCNFSVLSQEYSDTFSIDDVACGSGGDTAIDGLGIIVNGNLVTLEEEVEDLVKMNGYIEAKFVFIQAKTSSEFDSGSIGNFCFGVKDFFNDSPKLNRNSDIVRLSKLKDLIFDHGDKMRVNPVVKMYYVTTGSWQNDANIQGRVDSEKSDLFGTELFSQVEFYPVDASEIQKLYRKTKNKVSASFNFPNRVLMPDMKGVDQAYTGVLPAIEYMKIITDENGEIRKSLFDDNIRDYQDLNTVNKGIKLTLESDSKDKFAIFNNGVTLVARELKVTRDIFKIEDFQIVNGCQTSHVLFGGRIQLPAEVHVPLKVVVTTDEEVTNEIIKSTNRQTAIKEEDLSALTDFEKKLEQFYVSFEGKKRLFYERRPKQYANESVVTKVSIITRAIQIKAYSSIFIEEPHRAGRYYGTLSKELGGKRLFSPLQKLLPYYFSGYLHFKLDSFFRSGSISSVYKPFRYHILMVVRILIEDGEMPNPTANKMDSYCEKMCDIAWSDVKILNAFKQATIIIDTVGTDDSRETVKTIQFTDNVKSEAKKAVATRKAERR